MSPTPHMSPKVLTRDELLAARAEARRAGRRIVQCHGCFDLVHPGHVRHLRQARTLGDLLLVSITADRHVGKGVGRPLIPEELRAENLAALDFVDMVYIEPRATATELLEDVRPDVYVKGREYEHNNDPRFLGERQTVERHGGRVVFSSGDVVFSSTALIHALEHDLDPFQQQLAQLTADPELTPDRLEDLVAGFRGRRVVVVGETIRDTYVLCDRPDVAHESPVMTLRPLEHRHYLGGAAIVARHCAALGARPILVTALPETAEGAEVRRVLLAEGVEVRTLPVSGAIAEKQRFLVGAQKVMKIDLVEPMVLDAGARDRLVRLAETAAIDAGPDSAAIIVDFGLGLMTDKAMRALCRALRPIVRTLTGDVSGRRASLLAIQGADLLTPSESEMREALRLPDEGLPLAAWKLLEATRAASAIVTMGSEGLVAFDRLADEQVSQASAGSYQTRLRSQHVPALLPHAVDPLGCGDALLSTATLALLAGGSLKAAALLGAAAAAWEGARLGNLPCSAPDLRRGIARLHGAALAFAAPEVVTATRTAAAGRPSGRGVA